MRHLLSNSNHYLINSNNVNASLVYIRSLAFEKKTIMFVILVLLKIKTVERIISNNSIAMQDPAL